jgi:hypothetical protein
MMACEEWTAARSGHLQPALLDAAANSRNRPIRLTNQSGYFSSSGSDSQQRDDLSPLRRNGRGVGTCRRGANQCRTVDVDGDRYETIPAMLIVKAGLVAASTLLTGAPQLR